MGFSVIQLHFAMLIYNNKKKKKKKGNIKISAHDTLLE